MSIPTLEGNETVVEESPGSARSLDTTEAREIVGTYASGLVDEMAATDKYTLSHQTGSGQLGMNMIPYSLRSSPLSFRGREIASIPVVAAVSISLHDTGKDRPDIQHLLKQDVWDHPTRVWVRREHCAQGERRIGEYIAEQRALQTLGHAGLLGDELFETLEVDAITPERLLLLGISQFVARHHHSPIPKDYAEGPHDEAQLWGMTHLARFCDVLQALWFDRSQRRNYQKGRDGLTPNRPPELVKDIVRKECGYDNPVIMGVEIDMEPQLRRYLGLQWRANALGMA